MIIFLIVVLLALIILGAVTVSNLLWIVLVLVLVAVLVGYLR